MTAITERVTSSPAHYRPLGLAVVGVAMLCLPLFANGYAVYLAFTFCIFAVMGQAWNLLAGYCGLLSAGNQLYVGIGGFTLALFNYYGGFSVWTALPLAGLSAAAMGALLALPVQGRSQSVRHLIAVAAVVLWLGYEVAITIKPALDIFGSAYTRRLIFLLIIFLWELPLLKLEGPYFAVATWLIAAAVESVMTEWRVSGAGAGMRIESTANLTHLYFTACGLLILSTFGLWLILRSRFGPALTAIRDDAEAAAAVGIDIQAIKAVAFIAGALMTGLAGALYFMDATVITPASAFTVFWSAYIIFIVVAGGMGTLTGPLIGAALYVLIDRVFGQTFGYGLLILGMSSIFVIIFLPRGILGALARGEVGVRASIPW
jgi:branched-chain amino acid transport system permease protein